MIRRVLSNADPVLQRRRRRLLCRFVYATLTIFSVFAIVVGFFQVNRQEEGGKTDVSTRSEDSMVLYWLYMFHGSPLAAAYVLVYFGHNAKCWNLKRLRRGHHFKLNLLLASLLAAGFYANFFWGVLHLEVQTGPKLAEAIIIAVCELCLIGVHVVEEQEIRRERHKRKRLLRERQAFMQEATLRETIKPGSGSGDMVRDEGTSGPRDYSLLH